MASKVKFVVNDAGFVELLNQGNVQSLCYEKASGLAASAQARATYKDAEYSADVMPGSKRCHARAYTASKGAYWNEMHAGAGSGPLADSF